MSAFHRDLVNAKFIPRFSFGPGLTWLVRRAKPRGRRAPDDMIIEDVTVGGAVPVSLRMYRPKSLTGIAPALLWMHGGGFLIGNPEQDEESSIGFARDLGITVVALRYRLAPEHRAPAALDDAYAALTWVVANAKARGIDASKIAIGGASAGGGLAATLAIYAHDKGDVTPLFQLLVYPMLDDRTVLRTDMDTRNVRMWSPGSNRFAWSAYLGHDPGDQETSPYAAAARREDLTGLPPAWIGVGTLDLFHDEDLEYARRLDEAGVPCETYVVSGAFHGFDTAFRHAGVSQDFWKEQKRALRAAFDV
ncbi:MAG: alpha/beta hydrolase fold domain-containing protein [Salinibacterium sp.]|nr:alpha/beta hydrolase fold domain-containing protein [Salinibacterium sp.]